VKIFPAPVHTDPGAYPGFSKMGNGSLSLGKAKGA